MALLPMLGGCLVGPLAGCSFCPLQAPHASLHAPSLPSLHSPSILPNLAPPLPPPANNPPCRPFAEKYLADEAAFFADYVQSHLKLSELGVEWDGEPVVLTQ